MIGAGEAAEAGPAAKSRVLALMKVGKSKRLLWLPVC